MKKYTLWAAAIVCLLIGLNQAAPVYACSGYGQIAIGDLIERADIAVVGQFVELDHVRMNGIFRVSSYLMGEAGPEYLLLALNRPADIEQSVQYRNLSGGCAATAGVFNTNDTLVVFLRQRPDGAYERLSVKSGLYVFPDQAARVEVFLYLPPSYEESPFRTFSFDNLVGYITTAAGQQAQPPLVDQPYPLTTPIGITTEAGTAYVLPVDGSPPHVLTDAERPAFDHDRQNCAQAGCIAYSPDGLNQAKLSLEPAEAVVVTMLISEMEFSADALLFFPTSDSLAVWARGWIDVYRLYYPLIGNTEYHNPEPARRMQVRGYEQLGDLIGAWSPDGRMLAYSDAEGLWLWDVFTLESAPRLLIAAHEGVIPQARAFSVMGRYLAIEDGDHRYHLDLVSGEHYPDGLISPDERTLLAFDTRADGPLDLSVEWLADDAPAEQYRDLSVVRAEWIDGVFLWLVRCGDGYYPGDGEAWVDDPWCRVFRANLRLHWQQSVEGFAFDYDPATDKLVTIVDEATITMDGEERDLAPYLDSAIAEVKWLPSLYYH